MDSQGPFQLYSIKFQKVDKPFLSTEELKRVEETELKIGKDMRLLKDKLEGGCSDTN